MERLPMDTEKLLRAFQSAEDGVLTKDELKALLPETDVYEYRIGQLDAAGFIAPCAWEDSRSYDVVIEIGTSTAFCITVKGKDYLAQLDQKRKQRTDKGRKKKNNNARSEQKMSKNRNYDRHTALINLIVAIIGLVLAIGSAFAFLIEFLN